MRSTGRLKKRKRTKKAPVDKSRTARSFSPPEEVQTATQNAPKNSQLRELEPETFHIYETSNGSDVDDAPSAQRLVEAPEDDKQAVSETSIEDVADDSSPDNPDEPTTSVLSLRAAGLKKSARSKLQVPKNDAIKRSAGHASQSGSKSGAGFTAVNHNPSAKAKSPSISALDAPSDSFNGRWPCPSADTFGCTKTFSSRNAATRHVGSHSNKYTCSVCQKVLSRPDSLRKHMERHTALEISVAEAGKEEHEGESEIDAEEDALVVDAEAETLKVNGAAGSESHSELHGDETKDDGSSEYTTPVETSQAEAASETDQVHVDNDPEIILAPDLAPERASASPDPQDASAEDQDREITVPKHGQKRKREVQSSGAVNSASSERKKRKKETPPSSPTLVPSSADYATGVQAQQLTQKIVPQLQPRRQSSIEGWAQASKPGLNIRQSVLNPVGLPKRTDQKVEVVVPRTSQAGASSQVAAKGSVSNQARQDQREQSSSKETSNTLSSFARSKKSEYTTTNGKGKAVPGVNYSSPTTDRTRDSTQKSSGIATSVAKRTFPKSSASEINGGSASDHTTETADNSGNENTSMQVPLRKVTSEKFECRTCHKKFMSEKALKQHMRTPNVHTYLLKCHTCAEKFATSPALARHEKETGHGEGDGRQGQVGAFDDYEVQKLKNWKDTFCEEHNITGAQFNDMMTDSLQRGRNGSWNWLFINRLDFMAQYFNVLPRRDKRSMLRYRERNFQNVEGSLNWTEEDDLELIRLQKEMGTKWSKIAKVMMRTQDAVAQRWRHKLQFKKIETGEWSRTENNALAKAMEEVRRQSGVTADAQNWTIPWFQVSEEVKTRTPQQCSNRYRALHGLQKNGKYVPVPALEKTPGTSRILTPSKMQKRLEGSISTPGKRAELSSKYVDDEESDEEHVPEEPHGSNADETAQSKPNGNGSGSGRDTNRESGETPQRNNKLLAKKTPGKTLGSSQLFAQTQTNTSALKPPLSNPGGSRSSQAHSQSQERPSPNIPLQRRAVSRSPLAEILPLSDAQLDLVEDDNPEDSESGDDVDEDAENQQSEIDGSEAGDEGEADDGELTSAANGKNSRGPLLDDEAEETSEEDSDDEDEDDDDDKDDDDDDSRIESEENEQESSVDDETSDFMASINKSAQRFKSSQVKSSKGQTRGLKRKADPSEDESEDEDTESE